MTAPHDSPIQNPDSPSQGFEAPIQNFEAPIQKIEAPIQNTEAPIHDGGRREERRRVYFNIPQREVMATACRDTVVVGGRGIGKGVIHAAWNLRNMQRMAGSSTGIVCANYKRGLSNTLPSMLTHWEAWGYRRGVHWLIGVRPPSSWPRPVIEPQGWDNVLSLYNGSIAYIISQDRKGTSNSLTLDAIDIDEAKYIDFEQLKDETLPANRGNRDRFGRHYYHHGMLITSDMPVTKRGSWFLDYKKKCDTHAVELIQAAVAEYWQLRHDIAAAVAAGDKPTDYDRRKMRDLYTALCRLRAATLFYKEYSSVWNVEVLGEKWLRDMRRDLPPLTFQTSIMCQRIGIAKDGFYSSMTEGNKYEAVNFGYIDSLEYKFDKIKEPTSLADADVDAKKPLCVAFDYNANINWCVVGQPQGAELRVLRSFWVKFERKLPELIDDVCRYYRHHECKMIIFYYDATAVGNNYAVNDDDFHTVISREFRRRGWLVIEKYIGAPMPHMLKHLLINRMLAGKAHLRPRFNTANNEDLLLSVQTAGIYNGKKDKRGEKLAENEEDLLEHRTDGSDAFDTLCIGCEKYPTLSAAPTVTSDFPDSHGG